VYNSGANILHLDKDILEDIIRKLNKKFRIESLLTTSRGKVLEYLGLALDYTQKGKAKISMFEYVNKLKTVHLMTCSEQQKCWWLTTC